MGSFFKVFLRGIIVTICLPLIVVFLALYTVYLLIAFLIMFIRNAIIFFRGGSIMDTKQDVEARKILENQNATAENMTEVLTDLMHSAIAQNPEAVRAMADQQMIANRLAKQKAAELQSNREPAQIANDNNIVEEEVKND